MKLNNLEPPTRLIEYDGNTILALGISESTLEAGYFKYLNNTYFN